MATEAQRGSPVKLVASNVDAGLWHFTMGLPNSSKRASDNNGKETGNHNSIYGIRITEKETRKLQYWDYAGYIGDVSVWVLLATTPTIL